MERSPLGVISVAEKTDGSLFHVQSVKNNFIVSNVLSNGEDLYLFARDILQMNGITC